MRDYRKPSPPKVGMMGGAVAALFVFLPGPASSDADARVAMDLLPAPFEVSQFDTKDPFGAPVHGWTQYTPAIDAKVEIVGADGGMQKVLVRVAFGLGETSIAITNRYATDSCNARVILEHEGRHKGIVLALREEMAAGLRAKVVAVLAKFDGMARVEALEVSLKGEIDTVVADTLAEYLARTRKENAALDTQEAYTADLSKCDKW